MEFSDFPEKWGNFIIDKALLNVDFHGNCCELNKS